MVQKSDFSAKANADVLNSTRFPVSGSWMGGAASPVLGGGMWTWVIAHDGDVNSGNLTRGQLESAAPAG